MNKEVKENIEMQFVTSKHVLSNQKNNIISNTINIQPVHVYLLEKIEELQKQIDDLKFKSNNKKSTKI